MQVKVVGGKASVPVQEVQVRRCVFLGASVWAERQSVLQDDNELVNFAGATSQLLQDDAEQAPRYQYFVLLLGASQDFISLKVRDRLQQFGDFVAKESETGAPYKCVFLACRLLACVCLGQPYKAKPMT